MQTDKEKRISDATIDLSDTINNINVNEYKVTEVSSFDEKNKENSTGEDKTDIDDLVVNSMQKLVEEETNVAKAFVGSDEHLHDKKTDVKMTPDTQITPDLSQGENKNKKKIISIIAACVCVAIVAVIIVVVVINNNRKSFDYNYNKGIQHFNAKEYSQALPYMEKASSLSKGKDNEELQYDLYLCYKNLNQDDKALEKLKDILSFDEYNEKAIKAIASFYLEKNQIDNLNKLIADYRETDGEQYLKEFAVNAPAPTVEAGSYNENVELLFMYDSGDYVYYTLDGSTPTNKSTLYSGMIEIKSGTTTVKAIAYNESGVYSNVIELKYEIDYKKPSEPSINPVSGTYLQGQMISIDDIPEECKVYYTTDGTTPTQKSKEYSGEFEMPQGNTIVSAILVDKNNQVSSVAKRNYVVSKTSSGQITLDEATAALKTQLQNKQILLADGSTMASGGTATFSFQSRLTTQGIEIYYIRCDVKNDGKLLSQCYYGVGVQNGVCYDVTQNGSNYILTQL